MREKMKKMAVFMLCVMLSAVMIGGTLPAYAAADSSTTAESGISEQTGTDNSSADVSADSNNVSGQESTSEQTDTKESSASDSTDTADNSGNDVSSAGSGNITLTSKDLSVVTQGKDYMSNNIGEWTESGAAISAAPGKVLTFSIKGTFHGGSSEAGKVKVMIPTGMNAVKSSLKGQAGYSVTSDGNEIVYTFDKGTSDYSAVLKVTTAKRTAGKAFTLTAKAIYGKSSVSKKMTVNAAKASAGVRAAKRTVCKTQADSSTGTASIALGTATIVNAGKTDTYTFPNCQVDYSGGSISGMNVTLKITGSTDGDYSITVPGSTQTDGTVITSSGKKITNGYESDITLTNSSGKVTSDDVMAAVRSAVFTSPENINATITAEHAYTGFTNGWCYYGGKWYRFFNDGRTWKEALKFAEEQGGELASIDSDDEKNFLIQLGVQAGYNLTNVWVGYYKNDNGQWVWLDGSTYTNGQSLGNGKYATMYISDDEYGGVLRVGSSGDRRCYVIEIRDGDGLAPNYDEYKGSASDSVTFVTVTKNVAAQTGKASDISGTFYFTLFSDVACTKAVSKPQAVTVTDGAASSTKFQLASGTYYVAETNADGSQVLAIPADAGKYIGYKVDGNGTKITISADGDGTKVTIDDSLTANAVITNRYTPPETPTPSTGTITITKNAATQTGKTANISGTFYFTLFSDAACKNAVSKPQAVTVTDGVSSSTTFTNLAQGTYYAAETNADGSKIITTPADTDKYTGYGVDGNGTQVTISAGSLTGNAEITNRYTPTESKTPTTPTKPVTPVTPTSNTPKSDRSAQTGDGFSTGFWTLMMLLGAVGCITGVAFRRKESSEEK